MHYRSDDNEKRRGRCPAVFSCLEPALRTGVLRESSFLQAPVLELGFPLPSALQHAAPALCQPGDGGADQGPLELAQRAPASPWAVALPLPLVRLALA